MFEFTTVVFPSQNGPKDNGSVKLVRDTYIEIKIAKQSGATIHLNICFSAIKWPITGTAS